MASLHRHPQPSGAFGSTPRMHASISSCRSRRGSIESCMVRLDWMATGVRAIRCSGNEVSERAAELDVCLWSPTLPGAPAVAAPCPCERTSAGNGPTDVSVRPVLAFVPAWPERWFREAESVDAKGGHDARNDVFRRMHCFVRRTSYWADAPGRDLGG